MKPYDERDELRDKIIAMRKELNELTKLWREMREDEESEDNTIPR